MPPTPLRNVILSVAAARKPRPPHSLAATEGPVAAVAPHFAIRRVNRGGYWERFGSLGPSADSRSFGRSPAFVRVCIGDAAALRMTFPCSFE